VIRANDADEFVEAFHRISRILSSHRGKQRYLLVESFVPGPEVALEGLLTGGDLHVLALFDKPDPLDGPYFEETLYVTPSRLSQRVQGMIAAATARAVGALGLREGPVHAELRLGAGGPYVIEVAARSIGGLCSNVLRFGEGLTLEELILRHAIGIVDVPSDRESEASGVMMLPIPRAGELRAVYGIEAAREVDGVEDVTITIPLGHAVVPLPEGDRYLGFVFARGRTAAAVEKALREAHSRLGFIIAPPGGEPEAEVCVRAAPAGRILPVLASSR
jgi:biotin carboxylase